MLNFEPHRKPFTQDPPEIDKVAKVAPAAWNRLDADNFVVAKPWNAFQSMLI
jgi:hypothetical protein